MQEIKLKTASGVNAQPSNRTEQKNCHVCKEHGLGIRWERINDEFEKSKGITKIQGILTSQIRTRKSTDTPYMAFFRADELGNNKHSLAECERTKCKECEIPVVFRIWIGEPYKVCFDVCCRDNKNYWQKPNLTKGEEVILEGKFEQSKKSNRPSFTCYSYQLINSHGNN